ncbi:MAG: radical SAM protein [Deltaproteobacteria bacterium]|nr:radical SAM protein [Deltaproteobacteria bacterium]
MNAASAFTLIRPSFGAAAPQEAGIRLDLPVAAHAHARLRFAPADQTPRAMLPAEALAWLKETLNRGIKVDEAHLNGPGDPLAAIGPTLETLQLMRREYAGITLGLTTLGINGAQHAEALAEHGVSRVTLLVDAVHSEVVQKLYAWIRPGTKTVPLPKAADLLLEEQAKAIPALRQAGITVTAKTAVYPGINDQLIGKIGARLAELGAETLLLAPFTPRAGEPDQPPAPDRARLRELIALASLYIKTEIAGQPACCGQTGVPGPRTGAAGQPAALPKPSKERPNVAVVSTNGMDIDLHLGQAARALIYGPREDGLPCLLTTRALPEAGGGGARWEKLADSFTDCFALLTSGAGENPRSILSRRGITVLVTDGNVEGTVDVLYGGGKKGKQCRK